MQPKFISKEERQRLALERRQEQVKKTKTLFSKSQPQKNDDPEILELKRKYLLGDQREKKVRKLGDRKKFEFDWKADEDTSQDANPLYAQRYQPRNNYSSTEIHRSKTIGRLFDERHWKEKDLEEMTQRDWRIFREDFNITIRGGNIPFPIRKWTEAELPNKMLYTIEKIGYVEPTPIQRQGIPIQIENRDMIGIAETGSGKTASFVIPMLVFITQLPPITYETSHLGPYGLILAPTRELAQQIEQEAKKFAQAMGFIVVSIVGGHRLEEQSFNMRDGAHIVIATPGRLKDALDRRILTLQQCIYVVMDEADRMFEMKIESELRYILDAMPLSHMKPDVDEAENVRKLREMTNRKLPFRQTVMFSATMPPEVEKLVKQYMRRPATVIIGNAGQVVDRITQIIEMISDENRKLNRLQQILGSGQYGAPVIVFVRQKKDCDTVSKYLDRFGFKCTTLHSGKSQDQRESSLLSIREGRRDILIATDVAGRGIDIKDVSLVVNFDMAKSVQDYTHRIGRTGRAGKSGTAITFLSPQDSEVFHDLKVLLQKSKNAVMPPEFLHHEASQKKHEQKITQ
ncbi:P-loop containing nucleoside triphosphate hydrolase protein [Gorgonomyces haynaldii]|nr:P-loop containing nucleoside triphosphate hydrolase protein [Gorgonomyces haynaldii]